MTEQETDMRRTMVYTGPGASNSWIWLADFLERSGFLHADFCTSWKELIRPSEDDVLIVPGGDTLRMAEHAGVEGLNRLRERISGGSNYVGICAGAYLPLRSRLEPLSEFNLVDARIANISDYRPAGMTDPERYTVGYGCSLVFHPIRGPVRLSGEETLEAPLYGGPLLIPLDGGAVRLLFDGPADSAEILVDEDLLSGMLTGRAACIETTYGKGRVLLVSPHLEHPGFPVANRYMARLLRRLGCSHGPPAHPPDATATLRELRRTLADLRMVVNALESRSWKIGVKYWEGEKLLVFLDAVRKRLTGLQRGRGGDEELVVTSETVHSFEEALLILRGSDASELLPADLQNAVDHISRGVSAFFTRYFSYLRCSSGAYV